MLGKTLNHYKIVKRLGAGGMGEVYLAEDTRLDRQVALKILPAEFAADPARLARFQREARAVAAVNHPNIITLYSIEEDAGVHFLTLELMDGNELSAEIPAGGLPLARYLELASALASAVGAAHERGIVHRDLKPANVMVTRGGVLKVLDFGLARQQATINASEMRTATELTSPGVALGTVPYMSPEQVQGRAVDHRSDIFALGVIFHEMGTGKRVFPGDTSAELVSAIMRDVPPALSELRAEFPDRLARLVARCLDKDPHQRYQSALDLAHDLEALKSETGRGAGATDAAVAGSTPLPESIAGDAAGSSGMGAGAGARSGPSGAGSGTVSARPGDAVVGDSSAASNSAAAPSPRAGR